jgi:hypothetical protein
MKKYSARVLVYGALFAGVAGLSVAQPQWVERHGLDVWSVPELEAQIEEAEAEYADMDRETNEVLGRIGEKDALVLEQVCENADLLTAARQFRALCIESCQHIHYLNLRYPGMTDSECYCANLIEHAKSLLIERPELAPCVEKWQREFDSLRAMSGGLEFTN